MKQWVLIVGLVFSLASPQSFAGMKGRSCLNLYSEAIHTDLYIPGTALGDAFREAGSALNRLFEFGFAVLPVAAWSIGCSLPYEAVGICSVPFMAIRNAVLKHKFGQTLELLTLLEKIEEGAQKRAEAGRKLVWFVTPIFPRDQISEIESKMGIFLDAVATRSPESDQAKSDLIAALQPAFRSRASESVERKWNEFLATISGSLNETAQAERNLFNAKEFKALSKANGVRTDEEKVLMDALLQEYRSGSLFCGEAFNTENLKPLRFQEVLTHRFL